MGGGGVASAIQLREGGLLCPPFTWDTLGTAVRRRVVCRPPRASTRQHKTILGRLEKKIDTENPHPFSSASPQRAPM